MSRAQRRHKAQTVFARRNKQWEAASAERWRYWDGTHAGPAPKRHFLKNTARPCSCPLCKQPRYERHKQPPLPI
ncbi:MAG: hypothetical protein NVS3B25_21300 [Hymenobacter sp.]